MILQGMGIGSFILHGFGIVKLFSTIIVRRLANPLHTLQLKSKTFIMKLIPQSSLILGIRPKPIFILGVRNKNITLKLKPADNVTVKVITRDSAILTVE